MVTKKQPPIDGPAAVFVTITLRNWTPLFKQESCAVTMMDCLRRSLERDHVSCLAYAVMPSNLHLIAGLPEYQLLPAFIDGLKNDSSHLLWSKMSHAVKLSVRPGGAKSIWRPQYDEAVITSEKQFRVRMDDIHDNPVKVRIVERATDYEYSSARNWMAGKKGRFQLRWDGAGRVENLKAADEGVGRARAPAILLLPTPLFAIFFSHHSPTLGRRRR